MVVRLYSKVIVSCIDQQLYSRVVVLIEGQKDSYFEYGQLIYNPDKLPYRDETLYRLNSDVI